MKLRHLLLAAVALIGLTETVYATVLSGTVNYPNAGGVNGRLLFSLSQAASQSSTGGCGGPAVLAPTAEITVNVVNGSIAGSPAIIGNDCMSPSGLYYRVRLIDGNGNVLFVQNWQITGANLDVGTILPIIVPQGNASIGTAYINNAIISGSLLAANLPHVNTLNTWTASQAFSGGGTLGGIWTLQSISLATFNGSTSGSTMLKASAVAGATTLTLPAETGTLSVKPTITLKKGSGGGNYTSAGTIYGNVDGTNLSYTVTIPVGFKLTISCMVELGSLTGLTDVFAAIFDGSILTEAHVYPSVVGGPVITVPLVWVINGDGASHTVLLAFKTGNASDSVTIANSSATKLPVMVFTLLPSN